MTYIPSGSEALSALVAWDSLVGMCRREVRVRAREPSLILTSYAENAS